MIRLVLIAIVVVAEILGAQSPTAVCWRARPVESCRSWIVTETAIEMPVRSTYSLHPLGAGVTEQNADFGGRVTFTGGVMFNLSAKDALGFTGTIPGRIEGRYRRWLTTKDAMDASLGPARKIIRGADGIDSVTARGITASVGVSNTYIGLDARADLMRGDRRTVTGYFVGVRAGSRAGPVVAVAGFVLAMAAFVAMTGPNY